jgi:acid phosphatase family membrane protein YuiD
MIDIIRDNPFLVAILAAWFAQTIKVLTFLLLEKRVNLRRFVQSEGTPNMHSSAMTALTLAVGFKDGFMSPLFALSICLSSLIFVNTVGVKNHASRHTEIVELIIDRFAQRKNGKRRAKGAREKYRKIAEQVRYAPIDVIVGMAFGVVVALILY